MKQTRRNYLSAIKKLLLAKDAVEKARIAMQLNCQHKNVAEFPYKSDIFGHHHTPPYRVCADCGFAEYGWSCGYHILKNKPNVTEAERVGPIHENNIFVIPWNWEDSGKKPRTVREVYRMVIRGTLPKEYIENKK